MNDSRVDNNDILPHSSSILVSTDTTVAVVDAQQHKHSVPIGFTLYDNGQRLDSQLAMDEERCINKDTSHIYQSQ
jgi:hypothetical protein